MLIYLLRLADVADIDVVEAAQRKLVTNAARYPVEKAHGTAVKYTKWQD